MKTYDEVSLTHVTKYPSIWLLKLTSVQKFISAVLDEEEEIIQKCELKISKNESLAYGYPLPHKVKIFHFDKDKHELVLGNSYDKVEFTYPEDTTHILYKEFVGSHSEYNPVSNSSFPCLLKYENDGLYRRDNGIWKPLENGTYSFYDNIIKSIDDLEKEFKNPRTLEVPELSDFIKSYEHAIDERNYENDLLYDIDDIIYKFLRANSKFLYKKYKKGMSLKSFRTMIYSLKREKDFEDNGRITIILSFMSGQYKTTFNQLVK